MKFPTPMKPILLIPLLLALAGTPATADEGVFSVFGPAIGKVAQFSPEERRAMRERWEQASPEERLQIRREFQDRVRQVPQDFRRDAAEQWRNLSPSERERQRIQRQNNRQRGENADEGSFGTGFERRRSDEGRFESFVPATVPNLPIPNPGDFFDRRHNRDGNRDGNRPRNNSQE